MLKSITAAFEASLQHEDLSARGERMLVTAMYGALLATAYSLAIVLVNVYSFPGLPLGFDLAHILPTWAGISIALAAAGAIAGWFSEEYQGIVGGGAIITALLAVVFFVQMGAESSALSLQSFLMALPLIGVSMLAAGGLRWTARRHLEILHKDAPELRPRLLAKHLLVIVVVGAFFGILGRMDFPAERTLTHFHKSMQAAQSDPTALSYLPVRQVPALTDHLGVDYRFYVRRSGFVLGALDVTVRFDDGFAMTCLLPVGASNFITDCVEGDSLQ